MINFGDSGGVEAEICREAEGVFHKVTDGQFLSIKMKSRLSGCRQEIIFSGIDFNEALGPGGEHMWFCLESPEGKPLVVVNANYEAGGGKIEIHIPRKVRVRERITRYRTKSSWKTATFLIRDARGEGWPNSNGDMMHPGPDYPQEMLAKESSD